MQNKHLIESLKIYFDREASQYGLELVYLYGSRASGNPLPDSDLDLAVLFSDGTITDDESFRRICDLSLRLTGMLKLEVNVIRIRLDFDKPLLYYNAIVMGIPVYKKDLQKHIRIRDEAIRQMEDFNIFGPAWQNEATRRNLEALKHG